MRFDPRLPIARQQDTWSCFANGLQWSIDALGLAVPADLVRTKVRSERIVTPAGYLVDKTGTDLAGWAGDLLADHGLAGLYVYDASFDQVAAEAGLYPLVIGSGSWLHYAAVRGYDLATDRLLLANSSPGWMRVGHTLGRRGFDHYAPISLTRVAPPEIIGQIGEQHAHDRRSGTSRVIRPAALLVGPGLFDGAESGVGSLRGAGGLAERGRPRPSDVGDVLHELRRLPTIARRR